jgi:REP element-mobilizing transposase RayT
MHVGTVREPPLLVLMMLDETAMPPYDPAAYHRRTIRLPGYDYASAATYFITLCTRKRQCVFGDVIDSAILLSPVGQVVFDCWNWLPDQYPYVEMGPFVVMPNHLHGIITLTVDEGGSRTAPTEAPQPGKPIGGLIGAFKTVSTKRVNEMLGTPGELLWQRNYWEHIVRNDKSMSRICDYIENNPVTWESDKLHPSSAREM